MSITGQGNDSSFWVDYLENELEAPLKEDLDLLLTHSKTDQEIVSGLLKTKNLLTQMTHIELPTEESYYQQMHDRIMSQVTSSASRDAKVSLSKKSKIKETTELEFIS